MYRAKSEIIMAGDNSNLRKERQNGGLAVKWKTMGAEIRLTTLFLIAGALNIFYKFFFK
jgi:hypothetical protein